jgi:hypothetical protein
MRSLRFSILALAMALAGCSTLKVNTEYELSAPFASYKTYAWLKNGPGPEEAPAIRNPMVQAQVVAAVDRELAAKGIVLAKPDATPDFFVSVHGWAASRIEVTNYGYAYGGAYAYGPYPYRGGAVVMPATEVHNYTDGTLLVDFVDAKAMKLVWRGTATETFTKADLNAVKRTVDEAVRQLVGDGYPPKVK